MCKSRNKLNGVSAAFYVMMLCLDLLLPFACILVSYFCVFIGISCVSAMLLVLLHNLFIFILVFLIFAFSQLFFKEKRRKALSWMRGGWGASGRNGGGRSMIRIYCMIINRKTNDDSQF